MVSERLGANSAPKHGCSPEAWCAYALRVPRPHSECIWVPSWLLDVHSPPVKIVESVAKAEMELEVNAQVVVFTF